MFYLAKNLPNNSFSAQIPVRSGQNPISVTAKDGDGNVGTQRWTVTVPSGGTTKLSYDADGNTPTDPGHTDTYDPLDRLSNVTWTDGSALSISYDPLGLRKEEVLKNSSGTVMADNKLLWLGGKIVSDGTNHYWSFGQTTGTSHYYLATDHLGSLRDVTDANGHLVTEYDYDLWGNRTRIQGTQDFNLGFTGHWVIKDLVLAPFRTYNSYSGRWISRDPIGENGGINLYGYVGNDPLNATDPDGFAPVDIIIQAYIPETTAWVFNGNNHGATLLPSTQFKAQLSFHFDDQDPFLSSSIAAVAGPTIFLPMQWTSYADVSNFRGSVQYNLVSRSIDVSLSGQASDPFFLGLAPTLSFASNIHFDSNGGFTGSLLSTQYPSFQIFINGQNVYNRTEGSSDPFTLFSSQVNGTFSKPACGP
jgi:RHS repeat-associated protein